MDAQITPEPPEEERQAIDEALSVLLSERVDPYSEWWRAGVREELALDEDPA